eukprot:Pompholyxophrys_punicea_v1_NODE_110_length_3422_cov_27.309177.p5 type:complete len:140 gc:universal NODE_110_length_3422_cov_27.309177:3288-2869(-)
MRHCVRRDSSAAQDSNFSGQRRTMVFMSPASDRIGDRSRERVLLPSRHNAATATATATAAAGGEVVGDLHVQSSVLSFLIWRKISMVVPSGTNALRTVTANDLVFAVLNIRRRVTFRHNGPCRTIRNLGTGHRSLVYSP